MKIKYEIKGPFIKPKIGDYIKLKFNRAIRKVIGFSGVMREKTKDGDFFWPQLEGEYQLQNPKKLNSFNPRNMFMDFATPQEIEEYLKSKQ